MITATNPLAEIKNVTPVTREKAAVPEESIRGNEPSQTMVNEERSVNFDKKELSNALGEMNKILFGETSKFEFKVHEGTGRMLVKLLDKETNEVIREIPSEKILDLIANIWEMVGILVDERG